MAINQETFNTDLYKLLRTRGYKPVPKDVKNQRTQPEEAEVFNFTFTKDGKDYGDAWVTIDEAQNVVLYYSNEQEESPSGKSPNLDYDDSWSGLKRHLKQWSMNKQLTFELRNKDELGDDMAQRDYVKKKEKMNEGEVIPFTRPMKSTSGKKDKWYSEQAYKDGERLGFSIVDVHPASKAIKINHWDSPREDGIIYSEDFLKGFMVGRQRKVNFDNKQYGMDLRVNKDGSITDYTNRLQEGYHAMGKTASYNDNIPAVKIILQHNRKIEEGEQRYRNIAKIFLENQAGERFLAPTTRPGIAQVYARHIAEGGVPNDERWNHIKTICEEYSKMAGFVRATKNKQFNESAQSLVTEGINHYQSLRETLGKLRGHRGYNTYFESWTPALMEDDTDGTQINELFVQETVDPRIESVMPILSRLRKKTGEEPVKEVKELEQWAEGIVEGSEWERRHDEFVRAGEKVTSQEVKSIIEQLKKVIEVADKKRGMLNQIFGKVNNQQLAMDSVAATSFVRTLSRLIDAKPGTDERKELGQIVTYAKSLLRKATYLPNQDSMTAEGEETLEEGSDSSPVESAIIRRIINVRTELLGKHGPEKVLDAVKEVASYVGDVDEIGSSDVSGWIRQVERILSSQEVEEDLDPQQKKAGQLGPTEKVGKEGAVGKLVGANESIDPLDEIKRLIK